MHCISSDQRENLVKLVDDKLDNIQYSHPESFRAVKIGLKCLLNDTANKKRLLFCTMPEMVNEVKDLLNNPGSYVEEGCFEEFTAIVKERIGVKREALKAIRPLNPFNSTQSRKYREIQKLPAPTTIEGQVKQIIQELYKTLEGTLFHCDIDINNIRIEPKIFYKATEPTEDEVKSFLKKDFTRPKLLQSNRDNEYLLTGYFQKYLNALKPFGLTGTVDITFKMNNQ